MMRRLQQNTLYAMYGTYFCMTPSLALDSYFKDDRGRIYLKHHLLAIATGVCLMAVYTAILLSDQEGLLAASAGICVMFNLVLVPFQGLVRTIDVIFDPRP